MVERVDVKRVKGPRDYSSGTQAVLERDGDGGRYTIQGETGRPSRGNDSSGCVGNKGCLIMGAIGITLAVSNYNYGPVDFLRTAYNKVTWQGDDLRNDLLNHIRQDVRERNPDFDHVQIDAVITDQLGYKKTDGSLDFERVPTKNLWDCLEDNSGFFDRWVWPVF